MRLRVVFVVIAAAMLAGPPALASAFPDLPGMRLADRAIGGRTPSSLSTNGGTQTKKASAPASASTGEVRSSLPSAKSIEEMPGGAVLPAIGKLHAGFAVARQAATAPVGLGLLALFVVVGFTRMLYALNRVYR
jgi:hypothetical protein